MSHIRFEQVSLHFPGASHAAVESCNLEIQSGESIVLLGPSGCGKTTLLKLVNRLYEPTQGRLYLDDTPIDSMPLLPLRRQIGYVIQQGGLFPHLTIAQNIAIVPQLLKWSKGRIQERVEELLHLMQLPPEGFAHRYPRQLSGGQQQRVGIARALAAYPNVLLMDEPFGALDAITRRSLQQEILRLQRQFRKTILFVSHDVEEALLLADRILILQAGQVVQFATPLEVLTSPANRFVQELLGHHSFQYHLRSLNLLPLSAVMESISPTVSRAVPSPPISSIPISSISPQLTIAPVATAQDALKQLLQSQSDRLWVRDATDPDRAIGVITFQSIQAGYVQNIHNAANAA